MNNSEEYLKSALTERAEKCSNFYSVTPNITNKILINAADKICGGIDPSTIIAVYDSTVFSSGKQGIVFTGTKFYVKALLESRFEIPLTDIQEAVYSVEKTKSEDGTEQINRKLTISYSNGTNPIVVTAYQSELEYICKLINDIKDMGKEISTTRQNQTLAELGDGVVCSYINIATAYLKADDKIIDSKEYKELMSLMARVKISKALAQQLREYRFGKASEDADFALLVDDLKNELKKEGADTASIFQSLFKDLLMLRKESLDNWSSDSALCELKDLLNITEEQIQVFIRAIKADIDIIDQRLEDKRIKEMTKEFAAVAGGAGVTLAALAVTGGVSSGIWGGLITLGLMSTGGMIVGLAVIGGLGYASYKGIKYFAGTSELEKSGIRIAALQSAMEYSKATVTYIVDDINWLTGKLTEIMDKAKESERLDDEIMQQLIELNCDFVNISSAGVECERDFLKNEYESNIAKLPIDLSYGKYEELVRTNPNRDLISNHILSVYKQTTITKTNNDGTTSTKTVYRRDEELDYEVAKQTYDYLNLVGYYDTKSSAGAQIKSGVKSLKSLFN